MLIKQLTTAQILYRRPDCRALLQEFVWQDDDFVPDFPKLNKFLRFWKVNLDGPLYAVWVATPGILRPKELRLVRGEFKLN